MAAIYAVAAYGLWYFIVEPYLNTNYGEKSFRYVAYSAAFSVASSIFLYFFLVPVLKAILYR